MLLDSVAVAAGEEVVAVAVDHSVVAAVAVDHSAVVAEAGAAVDHSAAAVVVVDHSAVVAVVVVPSVVVEGCGPAGAQLFVAEGILAAATRYVHSLRVRCAAVPPTIGDSRIRTAPSTDPSDSAL